MCGPNSAIGLGEVDRVHWPELRERLREPGRLMALMRGVLGGDTEVACITSVSPQGSVQPLALIATPGIVEEIQLSLSPAAEGVRSGKVADYDVEVIVDTSGERPLAVLMSPWIFHNLTLYTRKLWSRHG